MFTVLLHGSSAGAPSGPPFGRGDSLRNVQKQYGLFLYGLDGSVGPPWNDETFPEECFWNAEDRIGMKLIMDLLAGIHSNPKTMKYVVNIVVFEACIQKPSKN